MLVPRLLWLVPLVGICALQKSVLAEEEDLFTERVKNTADDVLRTIFETTPTISEEVATTDYPEDDQSHDSTEVYHGFENSDGDYQSFETNNDTTDDYEALDKSNISVKELLEGNYTDEGLKGLDIIRNWMKGQSKEIDIKNVPINGNIENAEILETTTRDDIIEAVHNIENKIEKEIDDLEEDIKERMEEIRKEDDEFEDVKNVTTDKDSVENITNEESTTDENIENLKIKDFNLTDKINSTSDEAKKQTNKELNSSFDDNNDNSSSQTENITDSFVEEINLKNATVEEINLQNDTHDTTVEEINLQNNTNDTTVEETNLENNSNTNVEENNPQNDLHSSDGDVNEDDISTDKIDVQKEQTTDDNMDLQEEADNTDEKTEIPTISGEEVVTEQNELQEDLNSSIGDNEDYSVGKNIALDVIQTTEISFENVDVEITSEVSEGSSNSAHNEISQQKELNFEGVQTTKIPNDEEITTEVSESTSNSAQNGIRLQDIEEDVQTTEKSFENVDEEITTEVNTHSFDSAVNNEIRLEKELHFSSGDIEDGQTTENLKSFENADEELTTDVSVQLSDSETVHEGVNSSSGDNEDKTTDIPEDNEDIVEEIKPSGVDDEDDFAVQTTEDLSEEIATENILQEESNSSSEFDNQILSENAKDAVEVKTTNIAEDNEIEEIVTEETNASTIDDEDNSAVQTTEDLSEETATENILHEESKSSGADNTDGFDNQILSEDAKDTVDEALAENEEAQPSVDEHETDSTTQATDNQEETITETAELQEGVEEDGAESDKQFDESEENTEKSNEESTNLESEVQNPEDDNVSNNLPSNEVEEIQSVEKVSTDEDENAQPETAQTTEENASTLEEIDDGEVEKISDVSRVGKELLDDSTGKVEDFTTLKQESNEEEKGLGFDTTFTTEYEELSTQGVEKLSGDVELFENEETTVPIEETASVENLISEKDLEALEREGWEVVDYKETTSTTEETEDLEADGNSKDFIIENPKDKRNDALDEENDAPFRLLETTESTTIRGEDIQETKTEEIILDSDLKSDNMEFDTEETTLGLDTIEDESEINTTADDDSVLQSEVETTTISISSEDNGEEVTEGIQSTIVELLETDTTTIPNTEATQYLPEEILETKTSNIQNTEATQYLPEEILETNTTTETTQYLPEENHQFDLLDQEIQIDQKTQSNLNLIETTQTDLKPEVTTANIVHVFEDNTNGATMKGESFMAESNEAIKTLIKNEVSNIKGLNEEDREIVVKLEKEILMDKIEEDILEEEIEKIISSTPTMVINEESIQDVDYEEELMEVEHAIEDVANKRIDTQSSQLPEEQLTTLSVEQNKINTVIEERSTTLLDLSETTTEIITTPTTEGYGVFNFFKNIYGIMSGSSTTEEGRANSQITTVETFPEDITTTSILNEESRATTIAEFITERSKTAEDFSEVITTTLANIDDLLNASNSNNNDLSEVITTSLTDVDDLLNSSNSKDLSEVITTTLTNVDDLLNSSNSEDFNEVITTTLADDLLYSSNNEEQVVTTIANFITRHSKEFNIESSEIHDEIDKQVFDVLNNIKDMITTENYDEGKTITIIKDGVTETIKISEEDGMNYSDIEDSSFTKDIIESSSKSADDKRELNNSAVDDFIAENYNVTDDGNKTIQYSVAELDDDDDDSEYEEYEDDEKTVLSDSIENNDDDLFDIPVSTDGGDNIITKLIDTFNIMSTNGLEEGTNSTQAANKDELTSHDIDVLREDLEDLGNDMKNVDGDLKEIDGILKHKKIHGPNNGRLHRIVGSIYNDYGDVCLNLNLSARININNTIVTVPQNAIVRGNCSNSEIHVKISWRSILDTSANNTIYFIMRVEGTHYYISYVHLNLIDQTKKGMKEHEMLDLQALSTNGQAVNKSESISFKDNITLELIDANMKVQEYFGSLGGSVTLAYGNAFILQIASGCICVLVVLVVLGYYMYRKARSKERILKVSNDK